MSTPKNKRAAFAGESEIPRRSGKAKLLRLDDVIPKKNVAGGRRLLFGATDIDPTTNRKRS